MRTYQKENSNRIQTATSSYLFF